MVVLVNRPTTRVVYFFRFFFVDSSKRSWRPDDTLHMERNPDGIGSSSYSGFPKKTSIFVGSDDDSQSPDIKKYKKRDTTSESCKIQTGSIVFFDGKDIISNIIQVGTVGRWSHVGLTILMSKEFKLAFVGFLNRMKDLERNAPSPNLPISDGRFGMLNNIGAYSSFIKTEYFNKRRKNANLAATVFNSQLSEQTGGIYYNPIADPTNASAMAKEFCKPHECVRCVVAELNNIIFKINSFGMDAEGFLGKRKGDPTIVDDEYLKSDELLGTRPISRTSIHQTFNSTTSGKATIGNAALTNDILFLLSEGDTFNVEHSVSVNKDDRETASKKSEYFGTDNAYEQPSVVLLTHVYQLLEAANLIEMSTFNALIRKETTNTSTVKRTPYLWEATTDKMPNCYDELTSTSADSVKMTMLNNRFSVESYNAFAMREIEYKKQSENAGVMLKSISESTSFVSYDDVASLSERHATTSSFDDDDDDARGTSTPFRKKEDTLGADRYAHLFRTVSTITKPSPLSTSPNKKSFSRTNTIKYEKTVSSKRHFERSKSEMSDNTQRSTSYEQTIYKAIVCNMLINHGKSYQTTVTDFAFAIAREFLDCSCCFGGSQRRGGNNNNNDYELARGGSVNARDDTGIGNTHNDYENTDFFCSELVYQTLMDCKLYSEYRSLLWDFDKGQRSYSRGFFLVTSDDFENEDEYCAYMIMLSLIMLFKTGMYHDFLMYASKILDIDERRFHMFTSTLKDCDEIATKPTKTPIIMSSCCITPVDLFNLDIQGCLGVPVRFSEGAFTFNTPSSKL